MTSIGPQNITQKTNDWATGFLLNSCAEEGCADSAALVVPVVLLKLKYGDLQIFLIYYIYYWN